MEKPVAQAPEKAASEEKLLDDKELELERERKLKKEQKAREKEEKKLKAKQKEAARLQAQATSDGPKKSEKKQKKKAADDENPEDFIDPETPSGQKKSLAPQMAKQYSPSTVEKSWYAWWESAGYFGADPASSKPPFVIVLPPPNVTGALHIGHALTVAIEDAMVRWRRMSGYNALWVPGVDHAGIATQVVVEKKLMRERKLTRHDIGRDKFISEVLKWKDQYGGTILGQLRRLGASLDWSRECFTMDDQRSKAVTEAFVRLHKDGLVYRDYRLVNWDCTLLTAISDIEVDHLELKEETMLKVPGYSSPVQFGVLISFAYPLEEGLGEIIVATTRIETMLGDTAIAVHPEDKRYKHLHGKHAIHPFNGRKLKIICDAVLVDPTFGTGAVKITPAHDPNDFEVGKRHNLEFINIFTDDGKINSNGGAQFEGMPRFAARVAVIDALKEKGLYKDTKKNEMNLGICSRSNDVVEPMIKPQWFVNCHTMAKAGLDAVRSKKIEIIPQQYEQDWYRWLENIRDWCVSRQLWWGHRVPAWYVTLEDEQLNDLGSNNDRWIVARNECDAMLEAQKKYPGKKFQLNQDPDVLDTWFSSGLFPLTVLGWPDDTADLRAFYPTSVLETGLDILFFWVARMVMMGMQLGGDVPFQKVYLHPMIRDAHGRKMSKSLGNVVDPLEVINGTTLEDLLKRLEEGNLDQNELSVAREGKKKDFPDGIAECGTDALRFALISYTSQSDKINLDIKRVVGYRQWCNKLWNAIRFAMGKLGDHYTPPATIVVSSMPPVCKWILSVLNKAIGKTVTSLEAYKFADATSAIYSWWQYQLCDVFIEAVKPYFFNDSQEFDSARAACRDALWVCLDNGLRLLHPFMPYVTEELWQRLPQPKDSCRKNSIMISEYPSIVKEWADDKLESEIGIILDTVNKLRSLKPTTDTNERRPAFALCRGEDIAATVQCYQSLVVSLSSVSSLKILAESDETPPDCSTAVVNKDLSVYLQLQGALNAEVELEKLRKKRDEIQKLQHALSQKMEASGYREKAPPSVQEEDMRKLTAFFEQLRVIGEAEKKAHLVDGVLDSGTDLYAAVLDVFGRMAAARGILANTFEALESSAVAAIRDGRCLRGRAAPRVYCVGPLIAEGGAEEEEERHPCLPWLDAQPEGSVVYICFGSRCTVSLEQIREMAKGLEMSGHRFLWVLRAPPAFAAAAGEPDATLSLLPEGFLARTADRGLVVTASWVPQMDVLRHASTGTFITHCGWNSTLEAAATGVPMVCWPLEAEQWMNKVYIVEEMKVGVAVRGYAKPGVLVTADNVDATVRQIMDMESEGRRAVVERAMAVKESAAAAWKESGSSCAAFAEFVKQME